MAPPVVERPVVERQFAYEDFDLLIDRGGPDSYRARVLRSPAGECEPVQFTLPFSSVELENIVLKVGRGGRRARGPGRPESAPLKEFGGKLYGAVFQDELRDTLQRSLTMTRAQHVGLRLRLRLADTPELAELPWEFLYDPRHNRFLAQSRHSPLVRYLDLPDPPQPLSVDGPLRVMVMISSPSDYPELDVEQEWSLLTGALAEQLAGRRVIIERLPASMSALRGRLRRADFHVFHFVGHGFYRSDWGNGVLVMEDRNRRSHEVTGEELGGLLSEYDQTRLVVLNACEGARGDASDLFAGMAQSLIQQGLPAVVAMQFEITDAAAIIFAREFYGAIGDSYPLEAALAEARGAIRDEGNPTEWGTPVLYSRAPDGRLFNVTGHAREEEARQAREEEARQARHEAERQARHEAERQARHEAERQARHEAERQARHEAERQARGEEARQARHEAERQARKEEARQILTAALRAAQATSDEGSKAVALARVAEAAAAADPDRAERIARAITDEGSKAVALARVAEAVAAADPDRAERIAQVITSEGWKAVALARVAEAVAAADPDRAVRLTADAERAAQAITDEGWRAVALARVAEAVAAADPDRAVRLTADAERAAQAITDEGWKAVALARVAEAVAAADPDRAERIARAITSDYPKAEALARVAEAAAAADPDRAERIARAITSGYREAEALARVAEAVAAADPDRAERIARAITSNYQQAEALARVAEAAAAADPDRAVRLTADAERAARAITTNYPQAVALARVAEAVAAADPDRAERIARAITDEGWRAVALARVAEAVAAADPDRAERIAQVITDEGWKAVALARVAETLTAANPDRATSWKRWHPPTPTRAAPSPPMPSAWPEQSPAITRRQWPWSAWRKR